MTPGRLILLYHRITGVSSDPWALCVSPEHFEEHLQVLTKYAAVKLRELLDLGNPNRSNTDCVVAVTFDDGYADNFEEAVPLLVRYRIPATFFIATGYVGAGREFWWDELERFVFETPFRSIAAIFRQHARNPPTSEPEARKSLYFQLYDDLQSMSHEGRLALLNEWHKRIEQSPRLRDSHRTMTKHQISALATNDLFEIGSHTRTHAKLSAQSPSDQKREIVNSKTWLDAFLPSPVSGFSYPYGAPHHYDAHTMRIVQDAGFSYAVTSTARLVDTTGSRFELPRFNVIDMNGDEFERYLLLSKDGTVARQTFIPG
jgi:peptidoglycan/xylan/chitin deacetylase (PgdA/CDA1 family)